MAEAFSDNDILYSLVLRNGEDGQDYRFEFELAPTDEVTLSESPFVTIVPLNQGVYVDHGGMGLPTITVRGQFEKGNPYAGGATARDLFHDLRDNYIRLYALLKSDPRYARRTRLLWYNFVDGETWIVAPTAFNSPKTVSENATFDIYDITFTALGLYDIGEYQDWLYGQDQDTDWLTSIRVFITSFFDTINTLNRTIRRVSTRFEDMVDTFVTGPLRMANVALTNFISGVSDFIEMPLGIAKEILTGFDDIINTASSAADVPYDFIREARSVQRAWRRLMLSPERFSQSLSSKYSALQTASDPSLQIDRDLDTDSEIELAENDFASGIQDRLDVSDYTGVTTGRISEDEDIYAFAIRTTGSAAEAARIIVYNDLDYPYIAPATESNAGNVKNPGDELFIPAKHAGGQQVLAQGAQEGAQSVLAAHERLYGTDWGLSASKGLEYAYNGSIVDIATVAGLDNLPQAAGMKIAVQRGELYEDPEWGLDRPIGFRHERGKIQSLRAGIKRAVTTDDRFKEPDIDITIDSNILLATITHYPIGTSDKQVLAKNIQVGG